MNTQYIGIDDINGALAYDFIVDASEEGYLTILTDKNLSNLTKSDRYLAAARLANARYLDLLEDDEELAEGIQTILEGNPRPYTFEGLYIIDGSFEMNAVGPYSADVKHAVWGWRVDL